MAQDEETIESLLIKNQLLEETCTKWSNMNNRLRRKVAGLEQLLSGGEYVEPPEVHHPSECACDECMLDVGDTE